MESNEQPETPEPRTERSLARTGIYVLIALMILNFVEYGIAQAMTTKNLPVMIVINAGDAALIIYYFMHVMRAFRREH